VLQGQALRYACAFAVAVLAAALNLPPRAAAKRTSASYELRTVEGSVLNANGMPARSAVVYLYDDRTGAVRTFLTGRNGHYRFSGLYVLDDYQVYARCAGWISKVQRISRFDQRKSSINLQTRHRDYE
jgi:Carboxypeptidase regulatory-like domain